MPSGINNALRKTITAVTKNDAMLPIVALEAAVVAGRTEKAYKRGGVTEARERVIEETSGSVVWLGGVKAFNWLGDKAIAKTLGNGLGVKNGGANVDLGKDSLRKPFDNFINNKAFNPKNFSEKQISMMKFGKVAASMVAANYLIGFVVPKMNHKITDYFAQKDPKHIVPHPDNTRFDIFKESINNNNTKTQYSRFDTFKESIALHQLNTSNETSSKANVNFKGGLNTFTNFIENTNAGQLLSTDLGVLGGRTYNARKKEEKAEILIRDGGSIYFYMKAQDHVRAGLNKAESGRWTRLDPDTANIVHEHLSGMFADANESMDVKTFKEKVFGNSQVIDLNKYFKEGQEVISIEEFNKLESNPEIQRRAMEMSKLQPTQMGTSLLSKEQVVGVYTKGEMNCPKFLKKSYESFTEGASSNPNKFVSNKKLGKLKGRMVDYVDDIATAAEKGDGKVNQKLLKKMNNKNLTLNGVNFVAGFGVAALFLSRLIPDLQYWYTEVTTGKNEFPGVANYNKKSDKKS